MNIPQIYEEEENNKSKHIDTDIFYMFVCNCLIAPVDGAPPADLTMYSLCS